MPFFAVAAGHNNRHWPLKYKPESSFTSRLKIRA
ncbi:hypothetical protein E5Q_02514 [Mixia osmundae IAM 14324]|uniref:Uncharacterized protein n=1 Tax=Mixia osmundae (strain CBS 9802 / IAM 14324 / JCM 22182 / KY 12970) TaxID=764103 RepID=G7DZ47_MIXOS|nr:hypothetical protein E5Q_02514 [Mixia osmundae IAM 14324]